MVDAIGGGRKAARSIHLYLTGQEVTFDDLLNSEHEMAPNLDKLVDWNSPAPLVADANGRYPVPEPGIKRDREY